MRRFQQLLIVCLLPAMFVGEVPLFTHLAVIQELWNLGHVLVFFLLSRVVCDAVLARAGNTRSVLAVMLGIMALGLAIEFIQQQIGRDFSWFDWAFDIGGCLLALPKYLPGMPRHMRLALRVIVISLCLVPLGRQLLLEWQLYRQLPYLWRADSAIALQQVHADGAVRQVRDVAEQDSAAQINAYLSVQYLPQRYSNFRLRRLVPDWSAWHSLNLVIVNPAGNDVEIVCRVHDLQHERGNWDFADRFNRRMVLAPGSNHLQIALQEIENAPATRRMDLTRIVDLNCFAMDLTAPMTLDFIAIYLK